MAVVVSGLSEHEERLLYQAARREERSVAGQVRWIIRQWLRAEGLLDQRLLPAPRS